MSKLHGYSDDTTTVATVRERLGAFNAERDWGKFHTPKDLAMCVAAEAGELLEHFLWKREEDLLDQPRIEEELADVLISAMNLAARLDIDLLGAVDQKIVTNGERYPVERARGRADKYDAL